MKITELEIENFRSVKDSSFELSDFTILIGKNNSGKSNIIDCLHTFQNNHQDRSSRNGMPDSWRTEHATGKQNDIPIRINIQFKLSDSEHDQIIKRISENKEDSNKIMSRVDSPEKMAQDGFLSHLKYEITYNKDNSIDVDRLMNYGGEYVDVRELRRDNRVYGANINKNVDEIEREFDSWAFVAPFREPQNNQTSQFQVDLAPSGGNLIRVLHSLYTNYKRIFDKIRDAYIDIMEGVSNLSVEYDTDQSRDKSLMSIIVEEEKYDTKFKSEDISSGSKEILVLLTQIYLADEFTDVLIVEEPELHVHPKAEEKLFRILHRIVERGTQVIVATHSDVFVNESEASDIVRVERDGHTQIRTLDGREIGHELAELGYDKSGLLQSEAVVFVEGRSDKRILKKFCNSAGLELSSKGIAVVELEGIPNMIADAKSLVKLLYSFDIPYLFLRDSHDKTCEEAQGDLYDAMKRDDDEHWWEVSTENIHVWDSYGIESYLLDAEAISDGLEMSSSEVQKIIDNHDDTADKGEVLRAIYAEEHSDLEEPKDFYVKDRHGMEIAARIPVGRFEPEVEEVIIKIGRLLNNWDIDQLNAQISSS